MKTDLDVFDVQRTCVHDGPGIRTTIFFQGCNLRCLWCQNPEGLPFKGRSEYSLDDLLDIVSRDRQYYFSSDGGVTLSGGEPLLQNSDSLVSFLKQLKEKGIRIAVETTFNVPWDNISKVAPYIDLFLIDFKIVGNDELHKKYTGRGSKLIHENIKRLPELNARVRFRMVMIPGYTDGEENIENTAALLKSLGYNSIELLKYHNLYEDKAERLGLAYEKLNITPEQSQASLDKGVELFTKCGLAVETTAGDQPGSKTEFTDRVKRIQRTIRATKQAVCIEDSLLKTAYYRKHAFKKPYRKRAYKKPTAVHRAECLAHVLRNKTIKVYPEELLVGNFTSKRVGGRVWTEYLGFLGVAQVFGANRRTPVPFQCSSRDALKYLTRVTPYWLHHSHLQGVVPKLADKIAITARITDFQLGMNFNNIGIGHYIANYEVMIKLGTSGLMAKIKEIQKEKPENNQDFYKGALIALQGLEDLGQRYAVLLSRMSEEEKDPERRAELEEMTAIARHVPRYPARTFHEAVQSMLFLHVALCMEANENAISFGRIDQYLYPYYKKDLAEGRITYEKAKELLCLFILKMEELVLVNNGESFPELFKLFETVSTDQAYTFGGVDREGRDATNDLTYMLVDTCELHPRSADPAARIHEGSPDRYMQRIAEVFLKGIPLPQLFNDKIYIESLMNHYPTTLEDARDYSIVGCVEPVASNDHFGNTDCANMNLALPFLQALKGQEHDLWNYGPGDRTAYLLTNFFTHIFKDKGKITDIVEARCERVRQKRELKKGLHRYSPPAGMEELLERFQARLDQLARSEFAEQQRMEKEHRTNFQTPLASSLYPGCLESGKDATEGGTTFNSCGVQAVGVTDVADSLHAIDEVVFRKGQFTIEQVIEAIDSNFEGESNQRVRAALLAVPKFGDDSSPEATAWVNRVMAMFNEALDSVESCPRNGRYSAGYYALNVANIYGKSTPALPSGRLEGIQLANSILPHYGMQQNDLFSALNSISGVKFAEHAENGVTATLSIDAGLFPGEEGVNNLASLFKTFLTNGGMQLQPNILDRRVLLDAYKNPEKYPDLLVRIAGYCEYFVNLSDEMKLDLLNRSYYSSGA
ncbi:MAG: radical SAM protein [Firmicutes bacterium]|jgi:formate C-acetyltransferase|nr:radical SAM protein [Bacillota bacterium]